MLLPSIKHFSCQVMSVQGASGHSLALKAAVMLQHVRGEMYVSGIDVVCVCACTPSCMPATDGVIAVDEASMGGMLWPRRATSGPHLCPAAIVDAFSAMTTGGSAFGVASVARTKYGSSSGEEA